MSVQEPSFRQGLSSQLRASVAQVGPPKPTLHRQIDPRGPTKQTPPFSQEDDSQLLTLTVQRTPSYPDRHLHCGSGLAGSMLGGSHTDPFEQESEVHIRETAPSTLASRSAAKVAGADVATPPSRSSSVSKEYFPGSVASHAARETITASDSVVKGVAGWLIGLAGARPSRPWCSTLRPPNVVFFQKKRRWAFFCPGRCTLVFTEFSPRRAWKANGRHATDGQGIEQGCACRRMNLSLASTVSLFQISGSTSVSIEVRYLWTSV